MSKSRNRWSSQGMGRTSRVRVAVNCPSLGVLYSVFRTQVHLGKTIGGVVFAVRVSLSSSQVAFAIDRWSLPMLYWVDRRCWG
jgi:hypothetical protein